MSEDTPLLVKSLKLAEGYYVSISLASAATPLRETPMARPRPGPPPSILGFGYLECVGNTRWRVRSENGEWRFSTHDLISVKFSAVPPIIVYRCEQKVVKITWEEVK